MIFDQINKPFLTPVQPIQAVPMQDGHVPPQAPPVTGIPAAPQGGGMPMPGGAPGGGGGMPMPPGGEQGGADIMAMIMKMFGG